MTPSAPPAAAEPEEGGGGDGGLTLPQKKWASNMLLASYAIQYAGEFLVRQTKEQLWIRHFASDTVRLGLIRSQLFTVSQVISFFLTPLLDGLSDTFGRRPVLIFGAALYQLATVVVLTAPGLTGLAVFELLLPIASRAMGTPGKVRPFLGRPLNFHCLYLTFHCLSTAWHSTCHCVVSLTLHYVPFTDAFSRSSTAPLDPKS